MKFKVCLTSGEYFTSDEVFAEDLGVSVEDAKETLESVKDILMDDGAILTMRVNEQEFIFPTRHVVWFTTIGEL